MAKRSPAGPLMHEHRLIERLIALMGGELEAINRSGQADPHTIDLATDFIRNYADRCHHGKEEDILFRKLAEKDLDERLASAMEGLIQDHVHGRSLTGRLVDANARYAAGEAAALFEIESMMRELVEFYPVHIEKEDRHFFKPCLEYLSEEEQASMVRDFDEFDRSLVHERYRMLVEGLETHPSG